MFFVPKSSYLKT